MYVHGFKGRCTAQSKSFKFTFLGQVVLSRMHQTHLLHPSGLKFHFCTNAIPVADGAFATEGYAVVTAVEHVSCAPLWWPPVPEVHPSFELSWISDSGVDLSESIQAPLWNLETGDFTMSATWNGVAMCDVHYAVSFEPLPADFDDDGAIGTSDLLTMLSSIGCTGDCIQDFNADSSVTVMDLLVFLTVLGQSCT